MSYISRLSIFRQLSLRNVMTRNISQSADDLLHRIQKLREDNPEWRESHDKMCLIANRLLEKDNHRPPRLFQTKPPFKAAQNPDTTDRDAERRSRMHSVYG